MLAAAEETSSEALETEIDWVATMCADDRADPDFRVMTGHSLLDHPRERHRRVMKELVSLQRPGTSFANAYGLEDIADSFDTGDAPEWHRFANPWAFYEPEQILQRQERWLRESEWESASFDDEPPGAQEPFVRGQSKVGRNDPCPCGSGLKYKKCCMKSQL